MIGIKYAGPWGDYSGYGQATRCFIAAFHSAGVNVVTERKTFTGEAADFGWMGALAEQLCGREIDYQIKFIHLTPDYYEDYIEKDKFNIGHLFWETDRVPEEWVDEINKLDEVWTANKYHASVFEECGVEVPIRSYPQCLDYQVLTGLPPIEVENREGFLFYSIFQWTERKNPKALLKAYWEEFEGEDGVTLLLKTYRSDFTQAQFDLIREDIKVWKEELGQDHYPRVLLCPQLLSMRDMYRLHVTGDCFVLPHRGEGWGIPVMNAIANGTPVITTNYGGIHEYLTPQSAYLLPYKLVPVHGMSWIKWYTKDQKWAEPDYSRLKGAMRYVFEHPRKAKQVGAKAQELVKIRFDYRSVGWEMRKRIEEIERSGWRPD